MCPHSTNFDSRPERCSRCVLGSDRLPTRDELIASRQTIETGSDLITVAEMAKIFGIRANKVHEAVLAHCPSIKIGKRRFASRAIVEALARARAERRLDRESRRDAGLE